MKNRQISLKAGAIIIATAGIFFLGSTLAILNAAVGNKVNLFSGEREKVNVGIVEKNSNGEGYTAPFEKGMGQEYTLESNGQAIKEIKVRNIDLPDYKTGKTLVRVRVVPSFVYKDGEHKGQTVACDMSKLNIDVTDTDNKWYQLNNEYTSSQNYYYYSQAIGPNADSTSLKFTATYNGEQPKGTYLVLEVLTEGVSYDMTEGANGWRYAKNAWELSDQTINKIINTQGIEN